MSILHDFSSSDRECDHGSRLFISAYWEKVVVGIV